MSSPPNNAPSSSAAARLPVRSRTMAETTAKKEEPKKVAREADLLGFGDEDVISAPVLAAPAQVSVAVASVNQLDGMRLSLD